MRIKVKGMVGQEGVSERLAFNVKAQVRDGKLLGKKEGSGDHKKVFSIPKMAEIKVKFSKDMSASLSELANVDGISKTAILIAVEQLGVTGLVPGHCKLLYKASKDTRMAELEKLLSSKTFNYEAPKCD